MQKGMLVIPTFLYVLPPYSCLFSIEIAYIGSGKSQLWGESSFKTILTKKYYLVYDNRHVALYNNNNILQVTTYSYLFSIEIAYIGSGKSQIWGENCFKGINQIILSSWW